jgi:DNA-binding NtrC family response regulator
MARAQKPHTNGRRGDRGEAAFRATIEGLVEELTSSRRPWSLKKARHVFERAYTQYVIRRAGADRHAAATQLDIGFSTLKEKIRAR